MENKGFRLAIVIALGIFLGVIVVSKQKEDVMLRSILNKQAQILNSQTQMETRLTGTQEGSVAKRLAEQLMAKVNDLEARIKTLESRPQAAPAPSPQAKGGPQQPPTPSGPQEIPLAHSFLGGAKKGSVTIVEFVDYQCPFCARFHDPMVEAAKAYPKDVNYMIKHFPLSFHQQARPAAKAALAAGEQGKFLEMSDLLLDNQQTLSEDTFKKLATDLGLNVKKFWNDFTNNDAKYEKIIQTDMSLGSKVGVRGTPTFFINGVNTNARDVATWKAEIDRLLNK